MTYKYLYVRIFLNINKILNEKEKEERKSKQTNDGMESEQTSYVSWANPFITTM